MSLTCIAILVLFDSIFTQLQRKLGIFYEAAGHKIGDCFGKVYATRICVDLATGCFWDEEARSLHMRKLGL